MATVRLGGEVVPDTDGEEVAVDLEPGADHDAEFAEFMRVASPALARTAWPPG